MVNFNCLLDWIEKHTEIIKARPGVSVMSFPETDHKGSVLTNRWAHWWIQKVMAFGGHGGK